MSEAVCKYTVISMSETDICADVCVCVRLEKARQLPDDRRREGNEQRVRDEAYAKCSCELLTEQNQKGRERGRDRERYREGDRWIIYTKYAHTRTILKIII